MASFKSSQVSPLTPVNIYRSSTLNLRFKVKVRLQSSNAYSGTLDCITRTIRDEGPLALYKGSLSPLLGIAFCVSIQFATLENMKRYFHSVNDLDGHGHLPLSATQLYVAGGVAGVANSFVSGPVEHIRTRMQVQSKVSMAGSDFYTSTADCFKKIYGRFGVQGVYKGQAVTMLREWQGYGAYFLAYELLVQRAMHQSNIQRKDLSVWQVMSFGALAGYAMWIPAFPLDNLKSRIQTDSLTKADRKYKSLMDCVRVVLKCEGVAGLYRGFVPCMLRAAPVNAATFVAYEAALSLLSGK